MRHGIQYNAVGLWIPFDVLQLRQLQFVASCFIIVVLFYDKQVLSGIIISSFFLIAS